MRIHFPLTIFIANLLFSLRIHFEFNHQFTFYFANNFRIYYLFREFTSNSLSISGINFEFTIFFSNSLWIPYLFFANKASIHYLYRGFTSYSLQIHFVVVNFLTKCCYSDNIMSELSYNSWIYNMIHYTYCNIHKCWLQTSYCLSRLVTFEHTILFIIHLSIYIQWYLYCCSFDFYWLSSALLKALWSHYVIIFKFSTPTRDWSTDHPIDR